MPYQVKAPLVYGPHNVSTIDPLSYTDHSVIISTESPNSRIKEILQSGKFY
jgi:hypothetical protein